MKKLATVFLSTCVCFSMTATAFAGSTSNILWPDMFGDQEGTITFDDVDSTWSLTFSNPYGTYTIGGNYAEDGSLECTDDAGAGAFLPMDAILSAGSEALVSFLSGGIPSGDDSVDSTADFSIKWPDMFGDQEGTLTLNDADNSWIVFFENPYGAYTISGTYTEDGSMECTDDAGAGAFLPMDAIFAASKDSILSYVSEGTAAATAVPSVNEETGDEASEDFTAFEEIVTYDVLNFPTVFEKLPKAFSTYDTEYKGSQIIINYTTDVYEDGITYDKFARVYLPYGYDPEDTETKYNVLYLQHGNNCSPANFFDLLTDSGDFATILDNMFDPDHGVMDPCIIVCPTYYLGIEEETVTVPDDFPAGDGRYDGIPGNYYKEVIEDLIPAVEGQLNVYCDDFSPEGIKASRDHRAWGGYSRGSVCTWYMFHNNLEYFRYWMPTSAHCLPEMTVLADPNESMWTDEAAYEYIKEAIDANPDLPFFIIAQSGNETDTPLYRVQAKYFLNHPETFSYGMNPKENNFYYTLSDFFHVQQTFPYYLYTARNILFK